MNTAKLLEEFTAEIEAEYGVPWMRERRREYLVNRIRDLELLIEIENEAYAAKTKTYFERRLRYELANIPKMKREMNRLNQEIERLVMNKEPEITEAMIEKAAAYPIEQLVEVGRHGKIKCINPKHQDKHPSASIWNNRLKCWSCGAKYNSIDAYMLIHNTDFKTAVKELQ